MAGGDDIFVNAAGVGFFVWPRPTTIKRRRDVRIECQGGVVVNDHGIKLDRT